MQLTAKVNPRSPASVTTAAAARYIKDLRAAAIYATDKASKDAQRGVQQRIRNAGLGRLANAVGHTSTKREREGNDGKTPYGVIFARGGDESLAGGALESYSRGSTIRPKPGGEWLAFPTAAVPRFVMDGGRRKRLTPEIYMRSGLMQTIGKLIFRPLSSTRAVWVVRKVTVSPKGRAKAATPRSRSRFQKEVVVFRGIRVTLRAQRFDKNRAVEEAARTVPGYMNEWLAERRGGGV